MNAHSVLNKAYLVHMVGDFLTPDEVTTLARNRSAVLPSRSSFGEINFDFANTRDNIKKIKSLDDFKMVMESISKIKNMCTEGGFSKDRYLKPLIDDLIDSRNTMRNQDFRSSNRILLGFMLESKELTSINTLISHLQKTDGLKENELNEIMQIAIDTENLSPDSLIILIGLYPFTVSIDTIFEIQLALEGLDPRYSQSQVEWIKKFSGLPKGQRTGIFNHTFDLLKNQGPSSLQAMTALAKIIGYLPEDQRTGAFHRTLEILKNWGPSSSQAMTALAKNIPELPEDQKMGAFHRTLEILGNWGPSSSQAMIALTRGIQRLPQDQNTEAFYRILDVLKNGGPSSSDAMIALVCEFPHLPEDQKTEAFHRILDVLENWDPSSLAAMIGLADNIQRLPEDQKTEASHRFESVSKKLGFDFVDRASCVDQPHRPAE